MDFTKKNSVLVPKQRLFAPMLSTFGGGSIRGFKAGGGAFLFTEWTFTPCGQTGTEGPDLATCRSFYSPTEWDDTDTTQFNVTAANGYQDFKIIESGTYRLRVRGARGGGNARQQGRSSFGIGGRGAEIDVNFNFSEGDALRIIVGQQGTSTISNQEGSGGGGGGSFVIYGSSMTAFQMTGTYVVNNILVAAGGGGGATDDDDQDSTSNGKDANTGSNGTVPMDGTNNAGSNGYGSTGTSSPWGGGGGAGIRGDGTQPRHSSANTGSAPVNYTAGFGGGAGGSQYGKDGGFGGGAGGSWGGSGGGGYSGGGADSSAGSSSDKEGGGGGGSYKNSSFSGYSLNSQGHHGGFDGSVLLQQI